jgi:hypothetical protein
MTILLKIVTKNDLNFLFELLESRNSNENISHKKMPTFSQHKKFVLSKPYSKWYIIYQNSVKIGSIYLSKQDEIGMVILKKYKKSNMGFKPIQLLINKNPRKRYLANVSIKNKKSMKFFKEYKFQLIQHTFELSKELIK